MDWNTVLATIVGSGILAVCGGALTWMYGSYNRFVGMEDKLGSLDERGQRFEEEMAKHANVLTAHGRKHNHTEVRLGVIEAVLRDRKEP